MSVVAVSSPAIALQGAVELIAHSSTFQQRVGATNPNEAKRKIFVNEFIGAVFENAPLATVMLDNAEWSQISGGNSNAQMPKGGVLILFFDKARHADLSGGDDHNASAIDFHNFWGGVIEEMNERFGVDDGTDNFFPFNRSDLVQCVRAEIDGRPNEDYWEASVMLMFDSLNEIR